MRVDLTLAFALAACASRGPAAPTASSAITVPFQWIDNRVFVDVMIGERGPFHFILDTGADAAIGDTTARALGLVVKDQGEQDEGVGESRVQTGETRLATIAIGGVVLHDVDVEVLPLGDSTQVFGAAPVDGIIGLPVFSKLVVKHDFVHHLLQFTQPDAAVVPGIVVPFELPHQIPVIEAELDGVAGKFGVDTGARSALLLYRPFAESAKLAEKYGAHLEGVTGWGIGGPVRSLLARAHELRIGAIAVHDPVIRISTQKAGATTSAAMAGLIGPDVLSQFDVTFDYPHHRIVFAQNASYGRADSYDRAGVWMGLDAHVFTAVDVIAGGPADEAGLHTGDKILAIDGVATSGLVLPDVRERIRRGAVGSKLRLLVESAGTQRELVVTLRDLV